MSHPISINSEKNLYIRLISEKDFLILLNLGQAYEAEFSKLTKKVPDENGRFLLDTLPLLPYTGYLLYQEATPIGFCIINTSVTPMDIAEFYIIPSKRRQASGQKFAYTLFDQHQGLWQVRQILGADEAVKFWRRVIASYTNNTYEEEVVKDSQWGLVTRQRFSSAARVF